MEDDWDQVAERLDRFLAAFDAGELPDWRDFAPDRPSELRFRTFAELARVDLEYRWLRFGLGRFLEDYEFDLAALPESMLADLVLHELAVRRQAGDAPGRDEYERRFPVLTAAIAAVFAPPVRASLAVGESVAGFDVIAELGRGAFATAYLAFQPSLSRLVVLKTSAAAGSEAAMLARFDHPNIVRVFDQVEVPERGLRIVYMELAAGGALARIIDEFQRLPSSSRTGTRFCELVAAAGALPRNPKTTFPAELKELRAFDLVAWVGMHLARGLAHAHSRGVLHRDLKPANVLIAADGTPKIADFNVGHDQASSESARANLGGTLAYMSPEQLAVFDPAANALAHDLDGRSDLYSLGVLLWELATGRRPFAEPTTAAPSAILEERRKSPLESKGMPPWLFATLTKLLAFDPAERFASADDLAWRFDLCLRPHGKTLFGGPSAGARSWLQRTPRTTHLLCGGILQVTVALLIWRLIGPNGWTKTTIIAAVGAFGLAILLSVRWTRFNRTHWLRSPQRTAISFFLLWLGAVAWLAGSSAFDAHQWGKGLADFILGSSLVLLGSTTVFFLSAAFVVTVWIPPLLQPGGVGNDEKRALTKLNRGLWSALVAAAAGTMIALFGLAADSHHSRSTWAALAMAGCLMLGVGLWQMRRMQTTILALGRALMEASAIRGGSLLFTLSDRSHLAPPEPRERISREE